MVRRLSVAVLMLLVAVEFVRADAFVATFQSVHEAFLRLTVNESGFGSVADQDGILAALLSTAGGRARGRRERYGLNYRKLMVSMVRHSPRTFPIDSGYLVALPPGRRAQIDRLRTRQTEWTSTLALECNRPGKWKDGDWELYRDRCERSVRSTAEMLKGSVRGYCTGEIQAWGSYEDSHRRGGPIDSHWAERICDRPPVTAYDLPVEQCPLLRERSVFDAQARRKLLSSSNCARNYFWSWRRRQAPSDNARVNASVSTYALR